MTDLGEKKDRSGRREGRLGKGQDRWAGLERERDRSREEDSRGLHGAEAGRDAGQMWAGGVEGGERTGWSWRDSAVQIWD